MRARFLLLLPLLLLLASGPSARAAGPDPTQSSVDPCLIVGPDGDFNLHVTVRDVSSVPVTNAHVTIDLCACPDVHPCLERRVTWPRTRTGAGNANFQIKAGGVCPGSLVAVQANGVFLRFTGVASPDQNGDLIVDAADISVAVGKLGTADNTADFDCDGTVTSADLTVIRDHQGHACTAVPTQPASWGRLKAFYR